MSMARDPYSPENIEATAAREAQRRAAAGKQSAPKAAAEYLKGRQEMKMYEMGERNDHMKAKDHAPKQGVSPRGDLGVLSHKEMMAMFPRRIKGGTDYVSSQHLPMGKPRVASEPALTYKGMACGTSIYGAHDLKDYSGMKAGKMGGRSNRHRGTAAKDHGMTNDRGERNPSYGTGGNYVG